MFRALKLITGFHVTVIVFQLRIPQPKCSTAWKPIVWVADEAVSSSPFVKFETDLLIYFVQLDQKTSFALQTDRYNNWFMSLQAWLKVRWFVPDP